MTPIEFTNQLNDMVQDAMFHAKQFEQVKDMQNKSTLAEMLLKDMRNMIDLALTFPLESTSESFRKDWKEYQQEVKRLRRQQHDE